MFIIRIAVAFVLITVFVLVGSYILTKNKKYLMALKKFAIYTAWLAVILVLFNVISRVIRF